MRLVIIDSWGKEHVVCQFIDKFKACNFMCVADITRMLADALRKIKMTGANNIRRKKNED